MPRKAWSIELEDGSRRIEVRHSPLFGAFAVYVDGLKLDAVPAQFSKFARNPTFTINARLADRRPVEHRLVVLPRMARFGMDYELILDNRSVDTGQAALDMQTLARQLPRQMLIYRLSAILAGLSGWFLGRYLGRAIIVPVLLAIACRFVAVRLFRSSLRPLIPGFSIQVAQVLWFVLGFWYVVASPTVSWYWELLPHKFTYFVDPLVILIALVWLMLRPGLVSVVFVIVVQLAQLLRNMFFVDKVVGGPLLHALSEDVSAVVAHMLLRCLAIVLILVGFLEVKKQARETVIDDQ